jgi:hypothetical protein
LLGKETMRPARPELSKWPNAALLPIGFTIALLELMLGVGTLDAITAEPYLSINSYFSQVFLGLTYTYPIFIFAAWCIGLVSLVLHLCGVIQPWRSFARVSIYLFIPIVVWCFGQMCWATTTDGFYTGQALPNWMRWSGFSLFSSLWWYPAMGVAFVAWWAALMVRDDRHRSRQLKTLSSSL